MQANNPKGNKQLPKSIKIGEMSIPEDYFELDKVNKDTVCLVLMNEMLDFIDKQIPKHLNRMEFMDKIIESLIQTNVQQEHYEVAQVLSDIKQMINA